MYCHGDDPGFYGAIMQGEFVAGCCGANLLRELLREFAAILCQGQSGNSVRNGMITLTAVPWPGVLTI
jgi:hypothetical protein